MLPKDILHIIDNYNEPGIFVIVDYAICWFNGKRFESICTNLQSFVEILRDANGDIDESVLSWEIVTYENDLYCCVNSNVLIYKNRKFVSVKVPLLWNHPLRLFNSYPFMAKTTVNDISYFLTLNSKLEIIIENNVISTSQYLQWESRIFTYKNDIYIFGYDKNEKFNTITKQYTPISNTPFIGYDINLFNNKFYNIKKQKKYAIYDPEIDEWSLGEKNVSTRCIEYN